MDFWTRIGKGKPHREECVENISIPYTAKHLCSNSEHISSALSSPLTSLSSVDPMDEDDIEDIAPKVTPVDSGLLFDLDQLKAAMVRVDVSCLHTYSISSKALCGLARMPLMASQSNGLASGPSQPTKTSVQAKQESTTPSVPEPKETMLEAHDSVATANGVPQASS